MLFGFLAVSVIVALFSFDLTSSHKLKRVEMFSWLFSGVELNRRHIISFTRHLLGLSLCRIMMIENCINSIVEWESCVNISEKFVRSSSLGDNKTLFKEKVQQKQL